MESLKLMQSVVIFRLKDILFVLDPWDYPFIRVAYVDGDVSESRPIQKRSKLFNKHASTLPRDLVLDNDIWIKV